MSIAEVLGHTDTGLSNSVIDRLIAQCGLPLREQVPGYSKRQRLYDMFMDGCSKNKKMTPIFRFIEMSCAPTRFPNQEIAHDELRASLNQRLSFKGLGVGEDGKIIQVARAKTISEAQQRANSLRADLLGRGAHEEVLKYCNVERLQKNYFHAVFEAVKGLCQRVREMTGNDVDGQTLFDRTFAGSDPLWSINAFITDTEQSENKGFANVCKGVVAMVRNPLAHEPKIYWDMDQRDAADVLSTLSILHRKLDNARMLRRV